MFVRYDYLWEWLINAAAARRWRLATTDRIENRRNRRDSIQTTTTAEASPRWEKGKTARLGISLTQSFNLGLDRRRQRNGEYARQVPTRRTARGKIWWSTTSLFGCDTIFSLGIMIVYINLLRYRNSAHYYYYYYFQNVTCSSRQSVVYIGISFTTSRPIARRDHSHEQRINNNIMNLYIVRVPTIDGNQNNTVHTMVHQTIFKIYF